MPEITIDLSPQSLHLLKELERWGIYGVTVEEIAARFIDKALVEKAEKGMLKLVKKDSGPAQANGFGNLTKGESYERAKCSTGTS